MSTIKQKTEAATRVLKTHKAWQDNGRDKYLNALHVTDDQKIFMCDGFRAIAINTALPLPVMVDNAEYQTMTKTLYAHIEKAAQNDREVTTPSIEYLKAIQKDHRKKKKAGKPVDPFALYDAGGYYVQAKLLADILQLIAAGVQIIIDYVIIFCKSQKLTRRHRFSDLNHHVEKVCVRNITAYKIAEITDGKRGGNNCILYRVRVLLPCL